MRSQASENLFSGLNNLTVNTVLDEKYSSYFGFTNDEVREMASYYSRADSMQEIRRWYDGYRFGNAEIYNPWSVTSYFASDAQASKHGNPQDIQHRSPQLDTGHV